MCLISAVVLGITIAQSSALHGATSQFRTPLTFLEERGALHYPLKSVNEAWWLSTMDTDYEQKPWYATSIKGVYGRSATKSFLDECSPCKNKSTRSTVSLSTLWFGKESFRGEEVFPGSIFVNYCDNNALKINENSALGFSRITPRFRYDEYGIYCGCDAGCTLGSEGQWHVGVEARMPFGMIEITRDQDQQLYETVDDVVRMRNTNESGGAVDQFDFAARFDFLNTLTYAESPNNCTQFVQYNKPNGVSVTMPGVTQASGNNATDDAVSVFAIMSLDGSMPAQPFRKSTLDTRAEPIDADGSIGSHAIGFFKNGTDYASYVGLDRNTQGTLFIVPKAVVPNGELTPQAKIVSARLQNLVTQLNTFGINTPIQFFRKAGGINLGAAERITGQGDLFTTIRGGYEHKDMRWFCDGLIGLRFPTGVRTDDTRRVFLQSLGNNGHVELKIGIDAGWAITNWVAIEMDVTYYHAFKRTEKRAAPYKGATVKNIGPAVGVGVSWDYVTAHLYLNFFHPCNPELGCTIGYDFFAKSKDRLCIKCPPPADLLGRSNDQLPVQYQGYDTQLLSQRTDSMTHKFRAELFHRWNFWEFFAGAGQVFAGKNAMKETEGYVGVKVYF